MWVDCSISKTGLIQLSRFHAAKTKFTKTHNYTEDQLEENLTTLVDDSNIELKWFQEVDNSSNNSTCLHFVLLKAKVRKPKMRRGVEKALSYFKKLPLAFTLRAQGALPDKAFLRDRYGNLWPVGLAKIGDDWFLQDGWVKFVEDNTLEAGDFLVFRFDGTDMFDVKLFGSSGCEKKGVGALKSTVKEEEQDKDEDKEAEEDMGVAYISSIEDNHTNDDDDDEEEEEEEEDEDEDEDEDEEYIVVEEDGEEEEQIELSNKKEPKSKFIKGTKSEHKGIAIGRAQPGHKVRDIPESYGADIFKSGLYSRPKNPYFVAKLRQKRRDELYIPVDVVERFNIDLPKKMTLRDPEGRKYPTRKSPWKDGRIWYTGGWRRLCRWNLVEDGDRCICEFMKGKKDQRLFLQIRIVRAGATSK